jgi:hypothetical protein
MLTSANSFVTVRWCSPPQNLLYNPPHAPNHLIQPTMSNGHVTFTIPGTAAILITF